MGLLCQVKIRQVNPQQHINDWFDLGALGAQRGMGLKTLLFSCAGKNICRTLCFYPLLFRWSGTVLIQPQAHGCCKWYYDRTTWICVGFQCPPPHHRRQACLSTSIAVCYITQTWYGYWCALWLHVISVKGTWEAEKIKGLSHSFGEPSHDLIFQLLSLINEQSCHLCSKEGILSTRQPGRILSDTREGLLNRISSLWK